MENTKKNSKSWPVEPVQLSGRSRLRFACHSGLECFTKCCHGMNILLAPYDILRLKRVLGMSSGEFLAKHTVDSVHPESGLPIVILKMDGEDKACPFLDEKGCRVYEERPSICRYYPVGLATLRTKKDEQELAEEERFYFLIKEEHCLGHTEEKECTIDEWREDQGARWDDAVNRDWQIAFLSQRLPDQQKIDERRHGLFHMTCYDLDAFRRFVLESSFLEKFDVEADTIEEIREDDEALLRFALRYMKFFMMIDKTMTPRDGVLESWKKEKTPAELRLPDGEE